VVSYLEVKRLKIKTKDGSTWQVTIDIDPNGNAGFIVKKVQQNPDRQSRWPIGTAYNQYISRIGLSLDNHLLVFEEDGRTILLETEEIEEVIN
jgi:hypothetical protein